MSALEYHLFNTAVGRCGLVWGAGGIVGVQLPATRDDAAEAYLLRRYPAAREVVPPDAIRRVIDDIVALLDGERRDLSAAALDMTEVPSFHQRVYAVARGIRPGATLTYGEIAARLGDRNAAREVGEAMGRNPFPLIVPCHRVLAAGGKVGGFSAVGGVALKLRLLGIEGATVGETPSLFGDLPLAVGPRRRSGSRGGSPLGGGAA